MDVHIKIMDMKDGLITGFYIDDNYYQIIGFNKNFSAYIEKIEEKNSIYVKERKYNPRGPDKKKREASNVIEKWIFKNNISEFTWEDFFKDNPKQRPFKGRMIKYMNILIGSNKIAQNGNNKFIVGKIKKV